MVSDNMTQKLLFHVTFCQMPLRNSIAMVTPKVPGDQKYLKGCVIYTLILQITNFQLPTPNSF